MKQKFTINIADIEFNILSEGSAEEVNGIVEKVDKTIRTICTKSSNVTKTEAAILCALEFCSQCDRIEQSIDHNDERVDQLTDNLQKAQSTIAKLEARIEAQKEKADAVAASFKERMDTAAQTQKEKYEGRIENMKEKYETKINQLKAKLDELKSSGSSDNSQQISIDFPAEEPVKAPEEPVEVSAPAEAPEAPKTPAPVAENEGDKAKTKNKNKVGSMFELLTFGDV